MNCIALCYLSRATVCRGDHPPSRLVCSTGANVSVMVLQGCKSSPQKSRPLESGHRRHGVCIAIEYSYKLAQKYDLNFRANYAHFRKSGHILCLKNREKTLRGSTTVIWCISSHLSIFSVLISCILQVGTYKSDTLLSSVYFSVT